MVGNEQDRRKAFGTGKAPFPRQRIETSLLELDGSGSKPPAVLRNKCVLVVDDEAAVRTVSTRALEAAGCLVLEAANGREALRTVAARGQEIDVIVLDMTMPELSGEETLEELRRLRVHVPVVLSSGYAHDDPSGDGPGVAFLQKPFRVAELVRVVAGALR